MENSHLENIRKEIDNVDRQISLLIQRRMELVTEVAESKAQSGKEVLDKGREEEVIQNVLSMVSKIEYKSNIQAIFECIMNNSKEYQKRRLGIKNIKLRYAVIGEKLSHTISPQIHRKLFEKAFIDSSYEQIEIPKTEISGVLDRLKKEGFSGINVTIPYKTDIMAYLDSVSDIVKRIGAVNTVKITDKYEGYNTDYYGFGKALDYNGFNPENKACAVLGSGGATRAVVAYLEDNGASDITIVSRNTGTANSKFPKLRSIELESFTAEGYDLVVNATPVGMYPKTEYSPIKKEQLKGASFVMDLIYNPEETMFLKFAQELHIPNANGLYMLVAQAISSEEIWQGVTYDNDIINDIYECFKGSTEVPFKYL